jgi:hypothetical protein
VCVCHEGRKKRVDLRVPSLVEFLDFSLHFRDKGAERALATYKRGGDGGVSITVSDVQAAREFPKPQVDAGRWDLCSNEGGPRKCRGSEAKRETHFLRAY